jgi:hypothetical protein
MDITTLSDKELAAEIKMHYAGLRGEFDFDAVELVHERGRRQGVRERNQDKYKSIEREDWGWIG